MLRMSHLHQLLFRLQKYARILNADFHLTKINSGLLRANFREPLSINTFINRIRMRGK